MKNPLLLSSLGLAAAFNVQAQAPAPETGRVIASTPVIAQVAVQRPVCAAQPAALPQQGSGAGAVLGAVAGGLLGNALGQGSGRAAATAIGALGGAVVGNQVEATGSGAATGWVSQCHTATVYENRTTGYQVTYEYAGRTTTVQMPYDPGPSVALQVTPVGASPAPGAEWAPGGRPLGGGIPVLRSYEVWPNPQGPAGSGDGPQDPLAAAAPGYPAPSAYPAPFYYAPPPVYYPAPIYYAAPVHPVYPVYGVRRYVPPVGISLNLGYSRGYGRRHWR